MTSEKFRKFSFRWAQDFFKLGFQELRKFSQKLGTLQNKLRKTKKEILFNETFFLFCFGVICFPFIYYIFNMLTLHYILLPRFPHNLKMWILLSIFIVSQIFPPLSIFTVNFYVGVPTLE